MARVQKSLLEFVQTMRATSTAEKVAAGNKKSVKSRPAKLETICPQVMKSNSPKSEPENNEIKAVKQVFRPLNPIQLKIHNHNLHLFDTYCNIGDLTNAKRLFKEINSIQPTISTNVRLIKLYYTKNSPTHVAIEWMRLLKCKDIGLVFKDQQLMNIVHDSCAVLETSELAHLHSLVQEKHI